MPLIVAGYVTGGQTRFAVPLFLMSAIALSYALGALRLRTGSIWPPVLVHATVNAALLVLGTKITPGFETNAWVGESGVLMTAGFALLAMILTHCGGSNTAQRLEGGIDWGRGQLNPRE